ncbi:virulence RhuM family protein [Patescibacteria group bacterium]|nr:virulence RhuM family protein [Patescibacteria group bacterium]
MTKNNQLEKFSNFVIFKTSTGKVNVDVFFKDNTLWLTQKVMAELFETSKQNISLHLKNIFSEGELSLQATVKDFLTVQKEGNRNVTRKVEFYSLDAIIAVGYRVNSKRATQFRIWATNVLQEFIVRGFAMDDEKLKQIQHFGKDYFDELLERIREIRSSERRFYQKISDIYALSADYDSKLKITQQFFATVQNKLHWAITGKTAAEIIYSKVDASKIFMGLKTWKRSPDGKILKSDTVIAKNYLNKKHIEELNLLVSAYLDLAESRASRGIVMNMKDWIDFLHKFLDLSSYKILIDNGKISAEKAKLKAESEYTKFRIVQDKNYISDFDKEVKRLKEKIEK